MKTRLLVIDTDRGALELIRLTLLDEGFEVDIAASGSEGLALFFEQPYPVVLTELNMPGISGMDVLSAIKRRVAQSEVVVMTAYGSVNEAVKVMRSGAQDYLAKPFSRDDLKFTVRRALDKAHLAQENLRLRKALAQESKAGLVGTSRALQQVLEIVDKVGPTNATVLISGESGTGKELIARALHNLSERAAKPFVALSCAAIPATLLESELFGHAKGAFTGAVREQKGKFELAHSGTIFLDEVGEIPPELQTKLLRVLQERHVDPIGAERSRVVDVRVIAATNADLRQAVQAGRFREDLFYRLNVIPIHLPPLRERLEDVPLLFRYFLHKYGKRQIEVGPGVDQALMTRSWPGNVRELENLVVRLIYLVGGSQINLQDLALGAEHGVAEALEMHSGEILNINLPDSGISLDQIERQVISTVLRRTNGNKSAAARYLGIERHILLYRLKKLAIDLRDLPSS